VRSFVVLVAPAVALFAAALVACNAHRPDTAANPDAVTPADAVAPGIPAAAATPPWRATSATGDRGPGVDAAVAYPDRPYGLHVPRDWARAAPAPLVVFLHGYGSSGESAVAGFGLSTLADAKGFVLAYPDGTIDGQGKRFWNATDACCDFEGRRVDDVAYVAWLIDDVSSKIPIDPKRIYVAGHSNGGFLALRIACDLAPRLAAAVSVAGAAWEDPSRCRPTEPVSVLQLHGDADTVVRYGGGLLFDLPGRKYPGATATVATFASADGCTGPLAAAGDPFDFDALLPGAETRRAEFRGCPAGISVSLWTVAGGSHLPSPTPGGLAALWAWMAAHPRR
jgi:polyhydroxybutyrate depolymerase